MSALDPTQLPIDATQLPAAVRKAGPKAEQLYATALQFEQLLVEQLTQQLDSTDGSSDGTGDGSSDGTTALYSQMLPTAFAQGITAAGGLGLAGELYNALAAEQGLPTTTQTQTTQAPASAPAASTPAGPTP